MGRIVAIAGGNLSSTRELNAHTIKLTNVKNPDVLFIGTASHDANEYIEVITKAFNLLECEVKSLCLCSKNYTEQEIDDLLAWADIIYVGGGDTIFMMQIWKQYGLDEKLKKICEKDLAVLTGISAGAICWFQCGYSDSESFHDEENWNYCWADGMLDIFHMAYCPHYNEEGRNSFDERLREKDLVGLAMENDTAFVENNGYQYFVRSNANAKAFMITYKNEIMEKQDIKFRNSF
ncbi:MAG: Type 1 glutamine amidotransferase-like domain-containing protein [Oliverpabstia sp.]|nr:Type 1 glutamine amidotransferase-like domain-containing protein [Oliverpabstia sp.]